MLPAVGCLFADITFSSIVVHISWGSAVAIECQQNHHRPCVNLVVFHFHTRKTKLNFFSYGNYIFCHVLWMLKTDRLCTVRCLCVCVLMHGKWWKYFWKELKVSIVVVVFSSPLVVFCASYHIHLIWYMALTHNARLYTIHWLHHRLFYYYIYEHLIKFICECLYYYIWIWIHTYGVSIFVWKTYALAEVHFNNKISITLTVIHLFHLLVSLFCNYACTFYVISVKYKSVIAFNLFTRRLYRWLVIELEHKKRGKSFLRHFSCLPVSFLFHHHDHF